MPSKIKNLCRSFILLSVIILPSIPVDQITTSVHPTNPPIDNRHCTFDGSHTIPFQLVRNKTIVSVRINESREFRVILDTGMPSEGVLLFNSDTADNLNLTSSERMRIRGAGEGIESFAIRANAEKISLGDKAFLNQNILILQNDVMGRSSLDGVVGYTLFKSGVVQIDYDSQIITLHDPSRFEIDSSWKSFELFFNENNIPCLDVSISISGEKSKTARVYIDSASSEALEVLVKPDMAFDLPKNLTEKHLGRGLSGDIYGKFGQVAELKIGPFALNNVPTAFPLKSVRSAPAPDVSR
ncbi:aspartyl protease family protein [Acidobacteriota bacterium]